MRIYGKKLLPVLGALVLGTAAASAEELRVASWGGVLSEANRAAYWDPYEKATGIKIIDDTFNGEIAKIRAQVEAKSHQWEIAEVEDAEAFAGCEEGLYEKLDLTRIPVADLAPGTYGDCSVASEIGTIGLTYNGAKMANGPKTWAEFFDVKKFPGKRGMRKSATFTLEIALLGAGVPKEEVYKVLATKEGQDKAFAKLDEIKDQLVWWSSGTELVQDLIAGEFDIAAAYNGRVADANKTQGQKLEFIWDAGYVLGNTNWVILKGSPKAKQAMDFIAWATTPEPQAEFMRHVDYASANTKAFALLEPKYLTYMPNTPDRVAYSLASDPAFWRDNLDTLTERFNAWASK
ncbi:ABC transporter substrate-binding protein [Mesorhizobium sp. CO1-1-8]|uniref:ABC transporter substrate-binding protein n=1 Tax=Mesorhizobium sp. CO1-1-8 TaxID=2876631 RepID=UPI001CD0486C|nr:ABC transporter substrate-binding protein [Mesorhizobium sp. CO1-1-8]MBZ9772200.1 ABC transporter substrate-binding protein [Mesorhizobium sp. CO1-1-8]